MYWGFEKDLASAFGSWRSASLKRKHVKAGAGVPFLGPPPCVNPLQGRRTGRPPWDENPQPPPWGPPQFLHRERLGPSPPAPRAQDRPAFALAAERPPLVPCASAPSRDEEGARETPPASLASLLLHPTQSTKAQDIFLKSFLNENGYHRNEH